MAEILKCDETFDHTYFSGSSCAFGVFDGVHCGHRYLLSCAQQTACESGGASIALTFDIDPDEVFHPERLKKLMTNEERIKALSESGVDAVVVLPFTKRFSASTPEEFLLNTFNGHAPSYLHVGFDFRFGARAKGTVKELSNWAEAAGTEVCAHDLASADGAPITATRIRLLLGENDIAEANKLLGHPYYVVGTVEQGRGEGKEFGFRTANLKVPSQLQALGAGVYGAYAYVNGRRYKAAVSVGVSPVFEDRTDATCEAHLLDFEGDLYGKPIKVEFHHFLRPMIKFETLDELIATVNGNIAWVRENM
ncbi:riboflavin biosynthesis protein RibF [Raoultibacter timonensis]|uniref:riboflavin biosynthesis protein RibF n=1 Tax=Raoultibacter timonensis TaxID=1907662 RepID=UPI0026DBB043|nr:riboflavin biosynthesis protein RibF [Raoultibacter timonensis]